MTLLRGCAGSIANRATPMSVSYAPTSPNGLPPRKLWRVSHSTETSSARAPVTARPSRTNDRVAFFMVDLRGTRASLCRRPPARQGPGSNCYHAAVSATASEARHETVRRAPDRPAGRDAGQPPGPGHPPGQQPNEGPPAGEGPRAVAVLRPPPAPQAGGADHVPGRPRRPAGGAGQGGLVDRPGRPA